MLLARERVAAIAAVERLVGLQAQVARPPFIGLWTRLDDFTRAEMLKALHRRTLVRGTAMRGTLHVMSARDFVALRGAIQPALSRGMQSILGNRLAGLDRSALEKTGRAFFGKAHAPFDALRAHLRQKHPKGDERAMAYAIRCNLPLVQVPSEDEPWGFEAQADFALADAWLTTTIATGEAAPDALVRRYLAAFGPATPGDAQTWSALKGLAEVFDRLRPALVTFRDERKRELFDLPGAPRPDADAPAPVRFLPEFDNIILSHADRTHILPERHRARVVSKNLLVAATVLVDGFVAGVWKVARKKQTATLTVELFEKTGRNNLAAIEEEGEALLRFVEEDADKRDVRLKN